MKSLIDQVESVAIVQCDGGYKAHLRFKDSSLDRDIARQSHLLVYDAIERIILGDSKQ